MVPQGLQQLKLDFKNVAVHKLLFGHRQQNPSCKCPGALEETKAGCPPTRDFLLGRGKLGVHEPAIASLIDRRSTTANFLLRWTRFPRGSVVDIAQQE